MEKEGTKQNGTFKSANIGTCEGFYEDINRVFGYRQMCININREKAEGLPRRINIKRARCIIRIFGFKSVIHRKHSDYVKVTPEITAENILNRDFKSIVSFEKWLTDVMEFKYYLATAV